MQEGQKMPDTLLLVDLRRDSELSRQVLENEEELRGFLESVEKIDYMLVERIPVGRLKKGPVLTMRTIPSGK
jgi:hypothetical protein